MIWLEAELVKDDECPWCKGAMPDYVGSTTEAPPSFMLNDIVARIDREYFADIYHCPCCERKYHVIAVNVVKRWEFPQMKAGVDYFPALARMEEGF